MGNKQTSQKLRLMTISKILYDETDEDHFLSHSEINKILSEKGFEVPNRETFTDDIKQLISWGIDILIDKVGRENRYRIGSHDFELSDLKLIVDSIQSSRFLTEKKSHELIKKMAKNTSRFEAQKLDRQIYVKGRIKSENKQNSYSVDTIYRAIDEDKKIAFHYYEKLIRRVIGENDEVKIKVEKKYRHDDLVYFVSPAALISNNQNYYLVGCDQNNQIKHFRVDRMVDVSITDEARDNECCKNINIAEYAELRFDMFDGYESDVTLYLKDDLYMILEDRFGKKIKTKTADENHLYIDVKVMVSNQFLSWILSLGNDIKIVGPDNVLTDMKKMLKERAELYK